MTSGRSGSEALSAIGREDRSRLIAALISKFGDLDFAEDAAQDALTAAMETWPRTGIPRTPLAWLMTTATRKAIDRLRRERALTERLARLHFEQDRRAVQPPARDTPDRDEIPDDRLELFFCCCHPVLRVDEQVVLTLRYLGGLTTVEIAHAFLVPVPTMQQRLVRAKKRVRVTRIPLSVPDAAELPRRLPAVLSVIYLVFTEGYAATTGQRHIRDELVSEALRLARILYLHLPDSSEVAGLLALMLLTAARSTTRIDEAGMPVPLRDQDRGQWNRELVEEGVILAERAAATGIGSFSVQAAIAAVHVEAPSFRETDWAQIVVLYDLLASVNPSPVVKLARAVSLGRRDGLDVGLEKLEELAADPGLSKYHPFHEARAVTLEELGRRDEARLAWETAHELTGNHAEREYVELRWWNV